MTAKKDLKKRVRERQVKTGERYTTALKHVLGQAPKSGAPRSVEISYQEITPVAEAVGLRCRTFVAPGFPELLQRPGLEQLRQILVATTDEPGTRLFRHALLEGGARSIEGPLFPLKHLFSAQTFIRNLRLGIRGPSSNGLHLAFDMTGEGQPPATLVASVSPSLVAFSPSLKAMGWKLLLATLDDWLKAETTLGSGGLVASAL